jgi:lipoate-protein ligase B
MSQDLHIEINVLDGLVTYAEALQLQQQRCQDVFAGTSPNTLFLLQHTAVITMGRETKPEDVLHSKEALSRMGVDLCEADRGGEATYHGPGQLVAYPILNLKQFNLGIRSYIRTLEDVLIQVLDTYGLQGERIEGLTGVWVDGAKVAAIGIGVRNWVTMHGIALNIDPNMDHFKLIVPCGIADRPVTSMRLLLGNSPRLEEVRDGFVRNFIQHFSMS